MASLRYFDRESLRPGLPQDIGALVENIQQNLVKVRLVNLSPTHRREMTIQAGAYGEHFFRDVTYHQLDNGGLKTVTRSVNRSTIELDLLPGTDITLELSLARFANDPGYRLPWDQQ